MISLLRCAGIPGKGLAQFDRARKGRVLALNAKEMKHAWATCSSADRSLAIGIFCIPRHQRSDSHSAGCGADITGVAFR
jgi:hypothetical protein